MNGLWFGHEKTILADIGLRLVSTGLVIAVISGMADAGFGSQPPEIYYVRWALGVLIGNRHRPGFHANSFRRPSDPVRIR
jgi:hypothetical protein